MATVGKSIVAGALVLFALLSFVESTVLFSSLQRTLVVDAEIQNQVPMMGIAKAGEDHLVISWALNSTLQEGLPGLDATYETVQLKLCYAPVSQVERGWRKKNDDLHKDKTCTKGIAKQKYTSAGNSTNWRITKDVPGAVYFVRAYLLNSNGTQVAYGQTTNAARTTNLFTVVPISGRHASIDVAAAIFSAFSIGSLVFFLALENMRSKRSNGSK
ncbi:high-affinity nitrate transporter [Marchantia polymorpha subsp. ruderalis]|nr:hypothetical protein MARPO_0020s0039 [Marchantia polymorpha]BBN09789.1 hypothetical protein Mp_4g22690 [Marchantia polymorpha subsp. ruderalis]|eukprot:PTQ44371.1 hypothetical protein MARPO_0020s0039 [Marchantia polymorpha]